MILNESVNRRPGVFLYNVKDKWMTTECFTDIILHLSCRKWFKTVRVEPLFHNNSYHCVLIVDFNDNNGRVMSQFAGLSKQLHVLKDQQLVPCWTQCLSQHLGRGQSTLMKTRNLLGSVPDETTLTSVTWLCVEKKTLAKGSDRPVLSAANRLRAWYMWTLSWKICFTVGT